MPETYKKTILENGITVLSEKMHSVRSVAVGVWVKTGSRYEAASKNGIAHFLEHMMFKGTPKRSPLTIAQSIESLGGSMNAFTGKEVTCYFASALDAHLGKTVEVLADITCNSTFPEKEIGKERQVVLEEINSIKDTPEELIFDVFTEKLFPGHSLGRPILGTEQSVNEFSRSDVVNFWNTYYAEHNIVVAGAGNLEHDRFVELVLKYFNLKAQAVRIQSDPPGKPEPEVHFLNQPINQAHICTGGFGVPYSSDDRFALLVLNTYLGGGMSSRLFQQLREKHGLAYSVYSFADFYSDVGMFGVYIGTDPKNTGRSIELMNKEFKRLREKPIGKGTLNKIKNQLKGNLVLGLESSSRQMSRLAKNEIYFNDYIPVDTLLQRIDAVTSEDMQRIAQKIIVPSDFTTVILQNKN